MRIKTIAYGNNVVTSYAYDSRRPTWIKTVLGSTLRLNLTYTYDGTGNVLSIGNTGSTTESYSFDMLNRLASATGAWGTTRYGYDGLGNRQWMSQSVGGTNTTYTYLPNSYERLATAGVTSYTYDNNGNRLTQTVASTVTSYVYDFENRLTKVLQGSSTLGVYAYSPGGMRVLSSEAGNTTVYLNAGVEVLFQNSTLAGVSTITDYAHVDGLLISRMSGGSRFYYHQDHLGNTRLVTNDSNGRTDFSSNYQPCGLTSASTGNDPRFKMLGLGRFSTITYGNSVQTTYSYDPRGRPVSIKIVQGPATLLSLSYGYDGVSNVKSINSTTSELYRFDPLNRLVYSSGPWQTLQYGYDAAGNRLWMKQGAANTTYTYGSFNRLLSAGPVNYAYDNYDYGTAWSRLFPDPARF